MSGLWGKKKTGIQPVPPKIRVQKVAGPKKPAPLPSKAAAEQRLTTVQRSQLSPVRSAKSSARSSPVTPEGNGRLLHPKKRKALRQNSPSQQPLTSDSDDDDDESVAESITSHKKQRLIIPVDYKRRLRSDEAFSGTEEGIVSGMIHAADLPTFERKAKGNLDISPENVTVKVQYPSASQRERYNLVFGKDQIHPGEEIADIARLVVNNYLASEQQEPFDDPINGIMRRLHRANHNLAKDTLNPNLLNDFKEAVEVYNMAIVQLLKDGSLAKNLDSKHDLPLDLVNRILAQVYDRAVSPKVELLHKRRKVVENEKDNTYGELRPQFVSEALKYAGLRSDQIFVDLGSGVGNVVLQAALEFGCESFGCEMMTNACELAEAQEKEFNARCRLWGLKAGKVQLERGNFFENQATLAAVKRADVILVNNEVFSADTNVSLVHVFLDCKEGCKIVSLQPFVSPGNQIKSRTENDPANQLDVVEHRYSRGYVSWKDAPGSYYIATKDSTRFQPRIG